MKLNFVLSEWLKEVKTRRDHRKVCKPGGRKLVWKLISYFFLFYESYEIKFCTKISSFTVVLTLLANFQDKTFRHAVFLKSPTFRFLTEFFWMLALQDQASFNTSRPGMLSFTNRAPLVWNSLPASIKQAQTMNFFKSEYFKHLFQCFFELPKAT